MFNFVKWLVNLFSALVAKVQRDQLYDEAIALRDAGQYKEAFPIMQQACELGSEHAPVEVARMLLEGKGTACSWSSAIKYLELALERGIPDAHLNIGMIYGIGGYGLKRNLEKAEYHLRQAISVDNDSQAEQMLVMLRKKQGPFGAKEIARPKLPWK